MPAYRAYAHLPSCLPAAGHDCAGRRTAAGTKSAACSAYWRSQQQLPDPAAWAQIADPAGRLRAGLAGLYRYYRAGAGMFTHVYRDFTALPEQLRQRWREEGSARCGTLAAPLRGEPSQRQLIRAVIGHAASFWTWHSLSLDQGLAGQQAVDVMAGAVLAATLAPPGEPAPSPSRNPGD